MYPSFSHPTPDETNTRILHSLNTFPLPPPVFQASFYPATSSSYVLPNSETSSSSTLSLALIFSLRRRHLEPPSPPSLQLLYMMTSSNRACRLLLSSSTDHLPFSPSLSCPLLSSISSLYNLLRSFELGHHSLFVWIKSPVFAQKASVK